MIKFKNKEFKCSLDVSVDLIGGKWKVLILWRLKDGIMRFNELKRTIPNVTQKMLTQQLRELEEDSLINRKVYAEVPPKVEYSLTQCGKSLIPIFEEICDWGDKYLMQKSGGHIT